ncbi:polysaccharide lyase [Pseudomonas lini]
MATSGASDVNDSCEQNIENIYPSLPDVSQTFTSRQGKAQVQDSIKGSANLTNKAYSNEIKDITVHYPAGSYDPGSMVRLGLPYGGIEFKSRLKQPGRECLILTYELKFDKKIFNFVKGGKLPGLYGGTGNTGGKIPNGHDGFFPLATYGKKMALAQSMPIYPPAKHGGDSNRLGLLDL